jgi:hypothetical protein
MSDKEVANFPLAERHRTHWHLQPACRPANVSRGWRHDFSVRQFFPAAVAIYSVFRGAAQGDIEAYSAQAISVSV